MSDIVNNQWTSKELEFKKYIRFGSVKPKEIWNALKSLQDYIFDTLREELYWVWILEKLENNNKKPNEFTIAWFRSNSLRYDWKHMTLEISLKNKYFDLTHERKNWSWLTIAGWERDYCIEYNELENKLDDYLNKFINKAKEMDLQ